MASLIGALLLLPAARAGEFSVTPIRVELKTGVLSETISVTNHADTPLRVSVKLVEWTQDATGKDVYADSSDLVYFPRQLDLAPQARKLIRVGIKSPAGTRERTYRLFIEEQPEPGTAAKAQVSLYLRFGVPIFLPPASPRPVPEVAEPGLNEGTLSVRVANTGNQHFRLTRVAASDGTGWSSELPGWYSLADSQRSYAVKIPEDICRKARKLSMTLEGEGLQFERSIDVDPARCR